MHIKCKIAYNDNIMQSVQGGGSQGRLPGGYETEAHQIRGKGNYKEWAEHVQNLELEKDPSLA